MSCFQNKVGVREEISLLLHTCKCGFTVTRLLSVPSYTFKPRQLCFIHQAVCKIEFIIPALVNMKTFLIEQPCGSEV